MTLSSKAWLFLTHFAAAPSLYPLSAGTCSQVSPRSSHIEDSLLRETSQGGLAIRFLPLPGRPEHQFSEHQGTLGLPLISGRVYPTRLSGYQPGVQCDSQALGLGGLHWNFCAENFSGPVSIVPSGWNKLGKGDHTLENERRHGLRARVLKTKPQVPTTWFVLQWEQN